MIKPVSFIAISLACLALSSCRSVDNAFIVHDKDDSIASAKLWLCGARVELVKTEDQWKTIFPITCEGAGVILIVLTDGGKTFCPIGYVTPGLEMTSEYNIVDRECE